MALSALLPVAVFHSVASTLLDRWLRFDEAYSHGLVVLAMSIFFGAAVLWRHRFAVRPSLTGLALVAVTALGIALSRAVSVEITQQMGLVFLVWAMILGLIGWRAAWHFLFPVGLLGFAIPFWDYLAYTLQRITTEISGFLLGLLDIRFRIEGNTFIHLEDVGVIEVANGCSGQRYLVIALLLAAVFGRLYLRRPLHWLVLGLVALFLALLTNWVRVSALVYVGYDSVMQSSLLHQHEMFGWILFAVSLLPFFWVANRLVDRESDAEHRREGGDGVPRAGTASPAPVWLAGVFTVAVCLAVVVPAVYIAQVSAGLGAPAEAAAPAAPDQLGDHSRSATYTASDWEPDWRGADQTVQAVYEGADGEPVVLRIWHYRTQRPGHELIQYANRLYDPQDWHRLSTQTAPVDTAFTILENASTGERVALRYGYRVAGRWTTSRVVAKAYQLIGLMEGRTSAALVALSTRVGPDADPATVRDRLAGLPVHAVFADS